MMSKILSKSNRVEGWAVHGRYGWGRTGHVLRLVGLGNHNQSMKIHYICYFCVQNSL